MIDFDFSDGVKNISLSVSLEKAVTEKRINGSTSRSPEKFLF